MDYLSRRDRRRFARDLINRQIIEQAFDLQRQRDEDLRRQFRSIIHNNVERERHARSYSQSGGHYRDDYHRHGAASDYYNEQYHHRHRSNESRECSLITLTYRGSGADKHGDEIMIVQRGRTLFKGCLKRADQLTFKSKRYADESRVKLEFYINDVLEDRMIACCEHALINNKEKHFFQVDRVIGSKPCPNCQLQDDTSSSSTSPSPPSISKNKRPLIVNNNNNGQVPPPPPPPTTRQKSTTDNSSKPKAAAAAASSNNQQRTTHENRNEAPKAKSEVKSEKKKATTSSLRPAPVEDAASEGFPVDISDLTESQPVTTVKTENHQQNEDESTTFLPINSSTDRESPPPPPPPAPAKRIYGPPQLSTMLSMTEPFELPFENGLATHEESPEDSPIKRFESLNIQQEKDVHSDSDDNDETPNETSQSSRFLRSMSSNVETTQQSVPQTPSISVNSSRDVAMVNDATQLLLARLGIMRQPQVERPEPNVAGAPRQRGNVEYFVLVYLNSIPPDDTAIKRLRSLVNFIKVFDDTDDCMAFINGVSNEKVIFVSSSSFSPQILPKIEDLQQIFTIYILSENEEDHLNFSSSNQQSKVKGFYNDIDEICQQMSMDINIITRDLVSYINVAPNSNTPDATFVYSQLITDIILDSEETENAMKELVNFARQEYEGNEEELTRIDEFENDYQKDRAIWWFTRQCFLFKMLNKALRVPEADVLFKLRLFIQHLHAQIANESVSNTSLTVYLGQTIHLNDLDDLQKSLTNNNLLVFSQFLFGSSDLSRASQIARDLPLLSDGYLPVVLHVEIPSNLTCANTSSLRYVVDDDNDVLLNMGIMGRLTKVEKDQNNEHGITSVYLTLTKCENERNLQRILQAKKDEVKGAAPFVTLIKLMLAADQQARAEQLAQMIFDEDVLKTDPNLQGSLAASCHILGAACHARGDFKRAAELFHLSLDTFLRFVPADAVQLSPTYNNIGSMYFRQEEYAKAEEYHQKALDVQLKSHSPNLNSIASYSNNIGVVYLKQGRYNDAAKSFHRALKVLLQINQANDPDLASTYDNLGDAYLLQDKYEDALTYYSKALEVQRLVQPRNPQALASFNNSIGNVYNKLHRYGDALVHFKRALECHQEYLPTTHPSFASLYNNIGSMYYRQEQYAEALPCYLKSLEIELMCLPGNHPTIAVTHFNIATTYTGLGRFEEAIQSTERSVEQLLKTLPPNHPEVIENRSYIETIKRKQMLKGLFEST